VTDNLSTAISSAALCKQLKKKKEEQTKVSYRKPAAALQKPDKKWPGGGRGFDLHSVSIAKPYIVVEKAINERIKVYLR